MYTKKLIIIYFNYNCIIIISIIIIYIREYCVNIIITYIYVITHVSRTEAGKQGNTKKKSCVWQVYLIYTHFIAIELVVQILFLWRYRKRLARKCRVNPSFNLKLTYKVIVIFLFFFFLFLFSLMLKYMLIIPINNELTYTRVLRMHLSLQT